MCYLYGFWISFEIVKGARPLATQPSSIKNSNNFVFTVEPRLGIRSGLGRLHPAARVPVLRSHTEIGHHCGDRPSLPSLSFKVEASSSVIQ